LTLRASRPAETAALAILSRTSAKLAAMSPAAIDRLMDPEEPAVARATLARAAAALNRRNAGARGLPPLILLTDDERDADYVEAVRALPSGSAVIVRHRDRLRRAELARVLAAAARPQGSRCLIAGDLALAERIDADGIHAGEADIASIPEWRARHPGWLITAAIHAATPVERICDADALLLAPVFATQSHPHAAPIGVEAFEAVARRAHVPVYALGGVTSANVERLAASHAAGIALIGGWLRS